MSELATTERVLPVNIKAEQMLLGAIMLNHNFIERVSEFLRTEHFYEVIHQKIFHAIEIITERNLTPSVILLKSMLDNEQLFKELGGEEYLVRLTIMALAVFNPQDYGKVIFDLAIKRSLIRASEEIANNVYDSTLEYSGFTQLELAESKLYNLASEGLNERSFVAIKNHVGSSLADIALAKRNSNHLNGISTGLDKLDSLLSGFQNSDLIVVAARPGVGKTAFAINFAYNSCRSLLNKTALDKTGPDIEPSVGFISLEMSSKQLTTRLLSMMSGVSSTCLQNGNYNEEEYNTLQQSAAQLLQMPLYIDDMAGLTIGAIRTRARKLKRKHNLSILFIDYLQLIRSSDKSQNKSQNRVLEITEITQGLKALAKELDIPVIALSQLSRAVETRTDNRPMLSDLRESGSIEQDADIVMFIYHEAHYLKRKEPPRGTPEYFNWAEQMDKIKTDAELIIAKHRNGATGKVGVKYQNAISRVSNV